MGAPHVLSADHNTSIKMLKEVIFLRFGVPRYLMTDGGFDVGGYLVGGFSHETLGGDVLIG